MGLNTCRVDRNRELEGHEGVLGTADVRVFAFGCEFLIR